MKNNLKIAITGAHSQGKTTLCKDLMFRSEFRKFTLLGNITRGIQDKGIQINELGSDWSQSLVIAKHIEHYFFNGNALLDRCILDGLVYTKVLFEQGKVSVGVLSYAEFVFKQIIQKEKYDLIFYIEPTLPLKNDNVRSTDIDFFNQVKETFENYIQQYNLNVVRLSGSREERVNTVIKNLKYNFPEQFE